MSIVFVGLKASKDTAGILEQLDLKYQTDYILMQNNASLAYLPDDVSIVVCGAKYALSLGIKGKLSAIRNKDFHVESINKTVHVVGSINSARYNPNVVGEFITDMRKYLAVDMGINYNPTYTIIERPYELGNFPLETVVSFDIESSGTVFNHRVRYPTSKDSLLFAVFAVDYDNAFIVEKESFITHKDEWQKFFNLGMMFVAHNGKFDVLGMLKETGIKVTIGFDTLFAHHRIASTERHGLKHLLSTKYGFPDYDKELKQYLYKDKHTKETKFDLIPKDVFHEYSALDAVGTLRLALDLHKQLEQLHMLETFFDVDMPFLNTAARNEMYGRYVDFGYMYLKATQTLLPTIQKNIHTIRSITGNTKLNLNSPKQLLVEFNKLGLSTKDGTGRKVIDDLLTTELTSTQENILRSLKTYRGNNKIMTSYVNSIPKLLDENGYIYPTLNVTGTVVYRSSMKNPNLQQMPKTNEGLFVREAFVAPEGYVITMVDGASSQLRIAASLSNDANMIDVFNKGLDIHTQSHSTILEYLPTVIADNQSLGRRIAKGVNFGKLFGQKPYGLHKTFPFIPMNVCVRIHKAYDNAYPQYNKWQQGMQAFVKSNLYYDNIFGYRRTWTQWNYSTETESANFPIISTEAYVFNKSYAEITKKLHPHEYIGLHQHDEMQVIHKIEDSERVANMMMDIMLANYKLVGNNITFAVDGKTVTRWATIDKSEVLHKWSKDTNG